MCEEASDRELVRNVQLAAPADHGAFRKLMSRYQDRIIANCHHLTGSQADAEDLAQELFVKTYFAIPSFEGKSLFKTWLQRIKINHCLSHMRKAASKRLVFTDDISDEKAGSDQETVGHGESDLETQIRRRKVWAILEAMPEKYRIPLILCDMDGLTYEDAAAELRLGLSALKMRLKRGREQFRSRYSSRGRTRAGIG